MRKRKGNAVLVLLLGALVLGPLVARAEGEMTSSMQALEARMLAMEDKLAASQATIAAQREMLGARAAPAPSALDNFLSSIEIGGHVSASYTYNFNNPDQNIGNSNGGPDHGTQPSYQFNTDHNTFSFDAAKIELGKRASEPGTAGFQLDLLFGDNAGVLTTASSAFGATSARADARRDLADNSFHVQQAYVSYNASGIELWFGKFETTLGVEVLDSVKNPNVTHGLLYTWAIPLFHTGLLAQGQFGEGFNWKAGVVNGFNNVTDYGDNKGVLATLGWQNEMLDASLNAFIGSEGVRASTSSGLPCTTLTGGVDPTLGPIDCVGDNNHDVQIYDLVLSTRQNDQTYLWANGVYGRGEEDPAIVAGPFGPPGNRPGEDPSWYGASVGVKYDLNERTYLALRGEWLREDGAARFLNSPAVPPTLCETEAYSGTITLGYKLTENLLARLEYRHDKFDTSPNQSPFGESDHGAVPGFDTTNTDEDTQDVGLIQVSYIFD